MISNKNNIVFFGTGEFAAPVLKLLVKENWPIGLVVTQPDKPTGRLQKLRPSPVKLAAEKLGLKIVQPQSLEQVGVLDIGFRISDLFIVCDYGKLIPKKILDIPKFGCLNIHPSLLPLYRGPSPIQTAIINGDKETGASIMLLDEKMDHGPILAQKKVSIVPNETYPELSGRLAKTGAELLVKILPDYLAGKLKPQPQDDSHATYCKILKREDGKIDWRRGAREIYNQWRALMPWPGTYAELRIKNKELRIKISRMRPANVTDKKPGEFVVTDKKRLAVACGDGQSMEVLELQPEGKKPMNAEQFINGYLR